MSAPVVVFHAIQRYGKGEPKVHASVDGSLVFWDPKRDGWRCSACGDVDLSFCPHIDAVEALLAPSVLGAWDPF